MKFGKFAGRIPFLKRNKEEETNFEIETESAEAQDESSPVEEVSDFQDTNEGNVEELNKNNQEGELAGSTEISSSERKIEHSAKTKENKGKSSGEPAAQQSSEPEPPKKEASKTGNLMDELLKEIQSTDSTPTHLLAKSLDDVDINYLLTEGRTLVVRLKRRTGKIR